MTLLRTTTCDTLFVPSAFSSNILGSSDLDTYKFWMFHLFIKCMWNIWAYIFPPCSRQVDSSNCLRVMDDTYEQKALERDGKWGQHLLSNIIYIQKHLEVPYHTDDRVKASSWIFVSSFKRMNWWNFPFILSAKKFKS